MCRRAAGTQLTFFPFIHWDRVEGAAILVAVLAVTFTNAINDYQKERQFRKLNAKKQDKRITVFRNEREQRINLQDLVVGDIVVLEPGSLVPADCLCLSSYKLACDESSATGESDSVQKSPANIPGADCFLLSGSKVLEGVGKGLVVCVGTRSFFGKTMMALRQKRGGQKNQENTPLQLKLDVLAEQIAKVGFGASVAMLLTLTAKYLVTIYRQPELPAGEEIASTLVNIVIQTITIIVVAVPEGLPMAVTMALAFATTQMLKDNNLVRILAACETMGNATTICTDKTGTLTQNQMTVVKGTVGSKQFTAAEQVPDWARRVDRRQVVDLYIEGVSINSTAYEDTDIDGKLDFLGSKTECALLVFAKALGGNYFALRHNADVVKIYPFASRHKSMSTIIKLKDDTVPSKVPQSSYRIHAKGASEIILRSCTHYLDASGEAQPLKDEDRRFYERLIDQDASQALRTIAIAFRDISEEEYRAISDEQLPLRDLTLMGIVAIQDPLRPGVVESVAAFRRAGVFVRMITGDNIKTAKAIARNAGILTKGGVALSADQFRQMSPEEQRRTIPRMQVLARSSPTDKTAVVVRLQELDQVVGMTGDGTNDGPALKLADVGFSMGITGTEVAKEASDIVLMDDNFNSILKALLWGRTVNNGVRKFLTFQLTVNVAAVVVSFVSATTSDRAESVLTAVQLLWVNLIMDTLAALALATEPPTDDLLKRRPASKYAHLINYRMVKMILGQAIFQIAVNLAVVYAGPRLFHLDMSDAHERTVLKTMTFNIFVFLQVFNEINCRRIDDTFNIFKNLWHDWIFLAVQASTVTCQFLIITFGGIAFGTTPLTFTQWVITVAIGALSLPVGLIIRLLPDIFGIERRFNEDALPLASYSRLHWEGAIGQVRNQLRIYSILRKTYNIHQDPSPPEQHQYHSYVHHHPQWFQHPNRNVSEPTSPPTESIIANLDQSSVVSDPAKSGMAR